MTTSHSKARSEGPPVGTWINLQGYVKIILEYGDFRKEIDLLEEIPGYGDQLEVQLEDQEEPCGNIRNLWAVLQMRRAGESAGFL